MNEKEPKELPSFEDFKKHCTECGESLNKESAIYVEPHAFCNGYCYSKCVGA